MADMLLRAPNPDILAEALSYLPSNTSLTVLGAASNLLIRDGGLAGLTVQMGKEFRDITVLEDGYLRVGAAVPCAIVARTAAQAGIAGLEFLRGIPGTMGGATVMNAGAYTSDCSAIIDEVYTVSPQGANALPYSAYQPTYRHTNINAPTVVVGVLVRGTPQQNPAAITAYMEQIMAQREASQPVREKTGGSTFKNPPNGKAWQLIDAAGCRGLTLGGAMVSPQHCNFLINTGNATAHDLETLGNTVQQRVLQHSGVALEWEIKRIGRFAL